MSVENVANAAIAADRKNDLRSIVVLLKLDANLNLSLAVMLAVADPDLP
jgi:hypothetical protein